MADAVEALQDDDLAKALLTNQTRLEGLRMPREQLWREIDERVNVLGGGGFDQSSAFRLRGQYNFDATAVDGLDRFSAALGAITIPRNQQYIGLKFANNDLDKLPNVRRWCERASDRLYAIRYAPHAGFAMEADRDMRQTGAYGTAPMWVGEWQGVGLFYRAVHLSEIWIDQDFRGRVDTTHRKFCRTLRQIRQQYGDAALSPKMREALQNKKFDTEFQILTVIRPNGDVQPGQLDWKSKPIESIHIALDEKFVMRRSGFHSAPLIVSRDVLGASDVYGRSPAMKVFGTILGVNQMQRTALRAAHKAVDPALAFYSDDGISSVITKPGGLNPALMDEQARLLIARIPGGENGIPIAADMIEQERAVIRTAFLEEFFKVLTDPGDRMTATQVLEMVAKQGVLVGPFAERYETEKMTMMVDRELDLALRAGQIDPFPPEVLEARAWPKVEFDNPLSKMARAQEAAGLTRLVETLAPIAQGDPEVFDVIDTDAAAIGVADVLGVRPSWLRTPEQIQQVRQQRRAQQQQQQGVQDLATAASAYKDLAAGNATAQAA
ncbi:MAG: portal protein [Sphingomonas oligoaromativorans]